MQRFTVHAAKTNLSRLIEAALAGEEIVIAKGSKPVVRLVPVTRGAFQIGLLAGQPCTAPDFFEPMDVADLDLWEGGSLIAVLLDTNSWAWGLSGNERLSRPALAAIKAADAVLVSPITFFESARKVRLGKWPEMEPSSGTSPLCWTGRAARWRALVPRSALPQA